MVYRRGCGGQNNETHRLTSFDAAESGPGARPRAPDSGTSSHSVIVEPSPARATVERTIMSLNPIWDKTFPQSDAVAHRKVSFVNRYGIALKGDLYQPKSRTADAGPALVVCGPFGAVKEQSSGLYAQTMAARGYVTLAFDPSFTGESGGEPRDVASPDINTEDFSAAVDFIGLLPEVDRQRIGLIGICGFGGMGLNAAAADPRIKAVVTTSMYDMSRALGKGVPDSLTVQQRAERLSALAEQRWADAAQGTAAAGPRNLPETLPADADPVTTEFFEYYRVPRGFHPRSVNSNGAWTATMPLSFMNMPLLSHIAEIAPRPVLLIAGEHAHSRYFSEDAYQAAAEPKELMIIPGANHVDLYDRLDRIPFDRIERFFGQSLG